MKQIIFILLFPIFAFGQIDRYGLHNEIQGSYCYVSGDNNYIDSNLRYIRLENCSHVSVYNSSKTKGRNKPLKLKNVSNRQYFWNGKKWTSTSTEDSIYCPLWAIPFDSILPPTFKTPITNMNGFILTEAPEKLDTIPALYIYSDCDTCVLKNKRGYVSIPKNKSMIRQRFDINYQPMYVGYTIWMVKHERGVQMDTELPFTFKEKGWSFSTSFNLLKN
jgi:hypothetical protein